MSIRAAASFILNASLKFIVSLFCVNVLFCFEAVEYSHDWSTDLVPYLIPHYYSYSLDNKERGTMVSSLFVYN